MTQTNLATAPTNPSMSTDITGPGISAEGLDPARRVGCRHVDLGREDELVTWADWFQRSAHALEQFIAHSTEQLTDQNRIDAINNAARVYRVALRDGRQFAVSGVQTHTARGLCFPGGKDRFQRSATDSNTATKNNNHNDNGSCDVITGYTLIGSGPDGRATAISVPPGQIASVECVLIPTNAHAKALKQQDAEEEEAFGFAKFAQRKNRPDFTEIDEPHEKTATAHLNNT